MNATHLSAGHAWGPKKALSPMREQISAKAAQPLGSHYHPLPLYSPVPESPPARQRRERPLQRACRRQFGGSNTRHAQLAA
jgi:hypothetical protein